MQVSFEWEEPRARSSDPQTSKQAASQAVALQADHCALILACLKRSGPLGKDGLAARTRLDGVQTCRRLTELERAGLIRWTGRTVKSTAGRNEREWEAV
jgi:predicted ArsR family transcriptional regulator